MRVEAKVQPARSNSSTMIDDLCRAMGYKEDGRGFYREVGGEVYRPITIEGGRLVVESSRRVALRQRVNESHP